MEIKIEFCFGDLPDEFDKFGEEHFILNQTLQKIGFIQKKIEEGNNQDFFEVYTNDPAERKMIKLSQQKDKLNREISELKKANLKN